MSAAQSKSGAPDFAYPQQVSQASMETLKSALASGDPQATVRALVDYTLAQGSISAKNVPAAISLIDSVAGLPSTAPVVKAMLRTLQATIYGSVYQNERWKYDRRSLPITPLPDDMTEWSGEQFREVISRLYGKALTDSAALASAPLETWKSVVQQDRTTVIYYPTLLDFVASKAIETFSNWSDEPAYFPYSMVIEAADAKARTELPSLKRAPQASRILALYDMLIDRSRTGSAPDINYRLGRLNYLLDNSADSGSDRASRRYTAMADLYRSFSRQDGKAVSEYAGDIILQLPLTPKYNKRVYTLINEFLKDYPRYWRADCLRNTLSDLSRKEIIVEGPEVTAPGRETTFRIIMHNVTDATLRLYDVSSSSASRENYTVTSTSALKQVASLPVKVKGSVPFSDTVTVKHVFPSVGAFIAVPSAQGTSVSKRESYTKIRVSELAMIYGSLNGNRKLWAVSATDGTPLEGVKISINPAPYRDNSTATLVGSTDGETGLAIPDNKYGTVTAAKGSDRFASPVYIGDYTPRKSERTLNIASAYTSLPLYHHGDTVAWSAICYKAKGAVSRPRAGEEITVVLRDANYQNCDTLRSIADRFGRVSGTFPLPAEGLSGHYSLLVDGMTAKTFEVSDYKLPTFRVLPSRAANDTPAHGDVTLSGRVMSFSGFPIQGAEVKTVLSVSNGWRWGRSYEVETFNDSTDSEGAYRLVIPAEVFQSSPFPGGYYTASVSVTSASGETQTATTSFSLGKRYAIYSLTPANRSIADGRLPVSAQVKDYTDSIVSVPVSVTLSKAADTLKRVIAAPKAEIDLNGLTQGTYTLTFACADADTVKREIILYDPTASESPCPDQLLWSPQPTVSTDRSGKGSWLVAASCPTHILATVSTADSVLSQRWIAVSKGFNRIEVNLPHGIDEARLCYAAVGDYDNMSGSVQVTRLDSAKGLKIITETFRDRLAPGSTETITLRVIDLHGQGREAAVIAGMYNAAIDAVTNGGAWRFYAFQGPAGFYSNNTPHLHGTWSTFRSFRDGSSRRKCPELPAPAFNTWGRPFRSYLFGGTRLHGVYYKT
ncbi:MAG: hypothetical protein K2K72_01550, partial [Duncaniella sp.]|nr:hypothetical protein [Duncaniella sp.]